MRHPPLCEHVQPDGWPLSVVLVVDEQLGFTDAVVACRSCDRHYLLEMLDWRAHLRLMRVSTVEPARVAGLLHSLDRGSCDVRRAGAEVQQLQNHAHLAPWLLLLDARAVSIVAVVPVAADTVLPTAGWRTLPCDGSWIERATARVVDG